ncbi:serpin B3-like [Schistocerca piceifrons]|uniref:serpin B3-like n=1 Tax=Schistocerca piceifrons TaxID=274613 RepID=UPI001F5FBA7D|nr:serpin B3-like [Schistocerca piceifrons]
MAQASVDTVLQSMAESNVNFAFDMHKTMDAGNIFYSPLSIHVILTLVYFGAKGETARQIREGLRLHGNDDVIERGIETTMRELNASDDILLDIANRIFLKAGFELRKEFLQSADKFIAGVEQVNFHQSDVARKTINDWVAKKTHDKIQNLIPAGALDGQTLMVLVNAVYFKAEWQKQFNKMNTAPRGFFTDAGPATNVDMMQIQSKFKYAMRYDLDAQVLALPYKGNKFIMLVFLPRQADGLRNLESKLAELNLRDVTSNMYENDVLVYLPKFKMEYKKELNEPLQQLGMTDMFSELKANFTGITRSVPLHVDMVLHKAFIEVGEEGTEAAAATVVSFSSVTSVGGGRSEQIVFKADHPFLFFILHEQTRLVLFAGRYSSPPP